MYISKIEIQCFGKFHNYTMELSKGINVIYGGNETGKTTIKDYILGMLYGLRPRSKGAVRMDVYRRYQPLSGKDYGGIMTIIQGDKQYVLERSFEETEQEPVQFPDMLIPDKTAYMNTLCISGNGASYSSHLYEFMQKPQDDNAKESILDRLRLTEEQKRQMDPQLRQIISFLKVLLIFGLFAVVFLLIYLLPVDSHYKLWLMIIAVVMILYVWIRSIVRNITRYGKYHKNSNHGRAETVFDHTHELSELSKKAASIAGDFTLGNCASVKVDNHLNIQVSKDGRELDVRYMNLGTREQIYLAVRLAIAETMGWNQMPMLMDDIFGAYDDIRMQETMRYLAEYNTDQIIVFISDHRLVNVLDRTEIQYNYIEL